MPSFLFQFFFKKKLIKTKTLFDITQYKLNYYSSNLINFILPLILNILQISQEIKKIIERKKVIGIISTLDIFEHEVSGVFTHSLFNSNRLYTNENFSDWPNNILFNIINKLELYNSFNKIALTIKIKEINNL